jgi:RNA polymerase sigma factor (sigma-70 family)
MAKRETPKPCNGSIPDAIARLKARDMAAWECVIQLCSPRLTADTRTSLRKRLRENHLSLTDDEESQVVDELVSEVWTKFFTLYDRFTYQGDEKLFRYLHGIAINRIRRWVKARVKEESHLSIDDHDADDDASADWLMFVSGYATPSPEAQIIAAQIIEALLKVLDELKLNRAHCEIFLRRHMNDESVEALAAEYHMEPKSVEQALRRIIERIKPYLRPYLD